MRNRSQKTAETLLLEPTTKNKEKACKPPGQRPKPLTNRFRNSRTAAGFVSKPCETATTNNAETLPTKRIRSWMSFQKPLAGRYEMSNIKNHAKQRPRTMPKRCLRNALSAEWASKTCGGPLWHVKHQKLASQAFGGPFAQPPNSSRIRA